MWIKSKSFLRSMALILLLLCLLSSPLFAASNWLAIFGGGTSGSRNQASVVLTEESFLTTSETPSTGKSEADTMISESELKELSNLSKESATATEELRKSLEALKAELNALESVDAIAEADYEAIKTSLNTALTANTEQADRIAELENATKTRAYIMAGGGVGFKDGFPTVGVDLSLGARVGNHFMIEAGVGYDAGRFDSIVSNVLSTSLDNFSFNARIGWMF